MQRGGNGRERMRLHSSVANDNGRPEARIELLELEALLERR